MKFKRYNKTFIQAHRGASGYHIDNTMEAFKKAIELKADSIELDIRKTKDNQIIAVHDPTIYNIHINNWVYSDLCKETLKEGYIMPLLKDVLLECKGKLIVDVEFKEAGYEKEVIDLITSILDYQEFYIRSFKESVIKAIKAYDKSVYCILLIGTQKPKGGIFGRYREVFPNKQIKRTQCDAISPNYKLLILNYVKRMHRKKLAVYAWTVNDIKTMKKMIRKKVDGIVTNYPDVLYDLINGKSL